MVDLPIGQLGDRVQSLVIQEREVGGEGVETQPHVIMEQIVSVSDMNSRLALSVSNTIMIYLQRHLINTVCIQCCWILVVVAIFVSQHWFGIKLDN